MSCDDDKECCKDKENHQQKECCKDKGENKCKKDHDNEKCERKQGCCHGRKRRMRLKINNEYL